jgi:RHS repeat-associated protein
MQNQSTVCTAHPSNHPLALCLAVVLSTVGSWSNAGAAVVCDRGAPVYNNQLLFQMPPRNAVPADDDPALRTDNDILPSDAPGGITQADLDVPIFANKDTGNEVGLHNGMFSYRVTDLKIPGRGIDFEFTRRYDSKRNEQVIQYAPGALGWGWDHSYNIYLTGDPYNPQNGILLHNGNGRTDEYLPDPANPQGARICRGSYSQLAQDATTGIWIDRSRYGSKTAFESSPVEDPNFVGNSIYSRYRAQWMQDANGNHITFVYDSVNKLQLNAIIDTLGRTITFQYVQGLLQSITDFSNPPRVVAYGYNGLGELTSVRTPIVQSTGGFNDFPTGRTEQYAYLDLTPSDPLSHDLTDVFRPNDSSHSAVHIEYETNGASPFYDWVLSQTIGNSAAQYAPGGTISYAYVTGNSFYPVNTPGSLDIVRDITTVTDRNSQKTVYEFNENANVILVQQLQNPQDTNPYTTVYHYNTDGDIINLIHPEGNSETRTYVDTSLYPGPAQRFMAGNVIEIDYAAGPRGGDPRTVHFSWEGVFNHILSQTDERGYVKTFAYDYMEGSGNPSSLYYVLGLIATELKISETDANTLVGSTLANADLNGDGQHAVVHGNLLQRNEPAVTLSNLGGVNPQWDLEHGHGHDGVQFAITSFAYNGLGQLISETDPEENVSVRLYYAENDPDGDGIITGPGLNTVTGGYLKRIVRDVALPYTADPQLASVGIRNLPTDIGRDSNTQPAVTALTRDFFYDPVGHIIATVDPRGVRTNYSVNELGETWKVVRAADVAAAANRGGGCGGQSEDLTGEAYSYISEKKYDADGNVITTLVQNQGNLADQGLVPGYLETYYTYDLLDKMRTKSSEYGQTGQRATWTYAYDSNENLSSLTEPEQNVTAYGYEFRSLLQTVTRGSGTTLASTATSIYDKNGNRTQSVDGNTHSTIYILDGFDRVKEVQDGVGSQKQYTYDVASNVTMVLKRGTLGGPSHTNNDITGNVDILKTEMAYDERSRPFRIDRSDPQVPLHDGSLTPGDGKVTARQDFDRLSRRTFAIRDNTQVHSTRYDGSGRWIRQFDPVGNETDACWDDNSNPVKQTRIDKYPSASTKSYDTYTVFDSLNRAMSITDNVGQTRRFGYDSRDHVVSTSDAQASLSTQTINGKLVNNPGNTRRFYHDGFGRLVREEQDLRVGGSGDGAIDLSNAYNTDGMVTLKQAWNKNSQLLSQTDDSTNSTSYQYDALNRRTSQTFADTTSATYGYDLADNLVSVTDARGNHIIKTYDSANRLTLVDRRVAASGVIGTRYLQYEYDGLDRRTKTVDSIDNVLNDGNDWVVTRTFDALSRVTSETQNGRTMNASWIEEAKRDTLTYPSSLALSYVYDTVDRMAQIKASGNSLATYTYAGRERILSRTYRNGLAEQHQDSTGSDDLYYDGVCRPTRVDYVDISGQLQTGFQHAFDRASNRLYERRLHDAGKGDNYVYDSLYRLTTFEREVPAANVGTVGLGTQQTLKAWTLDGVQNWRQLVTDGVPANLNTNALNEYTAVGPTLPTYDGEGNLTSPDSTATPAVTLQYDFLNRLRSITSGTSVVNHDYDAEGRRVRTVTQNVAQAAPYVEYVYDSWQVLEERDASNAVLRRFVMGAKFDEPLRMENLAFYPGAGTYYFEQSTTGNVVALTNSSGGVVERYTYDSYGAPQFETSASTAKSVLASDFGNPYLFASRRYEPWIVPLYEHRSRVYNPVSGRFIQRDTIGNWTDAANLGNPYVYVHDGPVNHVDPFGMQDGVVVQTIKEPGFWDVLKPVLIAGAVVAIDSNPVGWGLTLAAIGIGAMIPANAPVPPPPPPAQGPTTTGETTVPPIPGPVIEVPRTIPRDNGLPFNGPPDTTLHRPTWDGKPGTFRRYGPDGNPEWDWDCDHEDNGRPHLHRWRGTDRLKPVPGDSFPHIC